METWYLPGPLRLDARDPHRVDGPRNRGQSETAMTGDGLMYAPAYEWVRWAMCGHQPRPLSCGGLCVFGILP